MSWTDSEINYLITGLDLLSDAEFDLVYDKLVAIRKEGDLTDEHHALMKAWSADNARREHARHLARDPAKRHPITGIDPTTALPKLVEANKAWEEIDGLRPVVIYNNTILQRLTPWWKLWDRKYRVIGATSKYGQGRYSHTGPVLNLKTPWWKFWKQDFRMVLSKVDK